MSQIGCMQSGFWTHGYKGIPYEYRGTCHGYRGPFTLSSRLFPLSVLRGLVHYHKTVSKHVFCEPWSQHSSLSSPMCTILTAQNMRNNLKIAHGLTNPLETSAGRSHPSLEHAETLSNCQGGHWQTNRRWPLPAPQTGLSRRVCSQGIRVYED